MENYLCFNLNSYERIDFYYLTQDHKNFDGLNKVKLNWIDKRVSKEHRYGYNRMCPFGLWILTGLFMPCWFLSSLFINLFTNNSDVIYSFSFIICLAIGIALQMIYDNSCDKIDYNTLLNKTTQINIFQWMDEINLGDPNENKI